MTNIRILKAFGDMATIPKYILEAAREYRKMNGGGEKVENAFLAGYEATKKRVVKDIVPVAQELFEECWKAYNKKGSEQKAFAAWCKLKDDERQQVMPHIKQYVANRERQYQKDFERYLRDRTFKDVVMKGNLTVYDPSRSDAEEYHPTCDGIFQYWDERNKRLIFNGDINHINDGYTDENRPSGAKAAWGMYEWTWSKERKEWVKQ